MAPRDDGEIESCCRFGAFNLISYLSPLGSFSVRPGWMQNGYHPTPHLTIAIDR